MRVENVSVDDLVNKIQDGDDPGKLYDVVANLCIDKIDWSGLIYGAKESGIVNQLGLITDLALNYVLDSNHPRCAVLKDLSSKLDLIKDTEISSFYMEKHPEIVRVLEKRLPYLLQWYSGLYDMVYNKWRLIISLDPADFKEVYELECLERHE